ncbi:MAG: DUF692 domain-containing protein [Hyphomicrobiales bacterium]
MNRQAPRVNVHSGAPRPVPAKAGIGLKGEHVGEILDTGPDLGFFEVHAENYMGAGGPPHRWLEAVAARYPLSVHGVGMNIGAPGPLDRAHLQRLKTVVDRYRPGLVSEHLAWSSHGGAYLNDLLPLPLNEATLRAVADHVMEVEDVLGRAILIENPSTYLAFAGTTIPETEFLARLVEMTGCGLLLDVNNAYVSAVNHGFDADGYIDAFPIAAVGEIHIAGHAPDVDADGRPLLVDAHDRAVADAVWALLGRALARSGPLPVLIERDNDVPPLDALLAEAARADAAIAACNATFTGEARHVVRLPA